MALHLTFDDGPSARWTPGVLRALEQADARATFFVLGPAARRRPDLVRAAVDAGHRVELHAEAHERHDRLSRDALRADTDAALGALARAGVRPRWWRTPWGRVTDDTRALAAEHGLTLVGWDADTHDWRGDRAEAMLDAVAREAPAGGVVLAHDGLGPGSVREGCAETVRFVGLAAAWARGRGLGLEALPDPSADGAPAGTARGGSGALPPGPAPVAAGRAS